MKPAPHFIITTGPAPGARLSLVGQWGNMPFPDAAAAEAEARRIGGAGATIARGRSR